MTSGDSTRLGYKQEYFNETMRLEANLSSSCPLCINLAVSDEAVIFGDWRDGYCAKFLHSLLAGCVILRLGRGWAGVVVDWTYKPRWEEGAWR